MLARLAAECVVVVRAREKVVASAMVMQRAWRGVLAARIKRLEGDILAFQSVARAWALRRALVGSLPGLAKGSIVGEQRVRGGW